MDFRDHTVVELAAKVRNRELTAVQLTRAALDNIDRLNKTVNAFCSVNAEDALRQAEVIDARIAAGEETGPLSGIPLGVKDLEEARGFVTTHGASIHAADSPAEQDSILVGRLRNAGCVVIGKTNTPEFGYKGMTDNFLFGATKNPWNLERTPGGSSGGSAAALASGMIPLATGSDGGGSIRIPSALCGFSGIKTSPGRVPKGGPHPPGCGTLSVKGPMALRTRDIAYALDACMGDDPSDIFGMPHDGEKWYAQLSRTELPAKVVWSPTMGFAKVDREVLSVCEAAVQKLAANGVEVIPVEKIWDEDPGKTWLKIWTASSARIYGHLRGTEKWELIDHNLRNQIVTGLEKVTGVDYANALDACHFLNLKLEDAFANAPLILCPTTCGQPPRLTGGGFIDGEETERWVSFTYGINMTRNPAGTVCAGFTGAGLPVGLQIIGRQREDLAVLKAMASIEDLFGLAQKASVS